MSEAGWCRLTDVVRRREPLLPPPIPAWERYSTWFGDCSLRVSTPDPPHVVREIVGHSAIDVTMTIYAHASLEEKRTAMRLLGEKLA